MALLFNTEALEPELQKLAHDQSAFYRKPTLTRFMMLFMGKLLPIYILLFSGILLGLSLVNYGVNFISGLLFDASVYGQTWLIFSWTLVPTFIWMGVAVTLNYKDYAKSWYGWTAATLALSLAATWLLLPEWSSWIKLHLPVSLFCHLLIYMHLSHIPFPRKIRMPVYGLGGFLMLLNLLTFIL